MQPDDEGRSMRLSANFEKHASTEPGKARLQVGWFLEHQRKAGIVISRQSVVRSAYMNKTHAKSREPVGGDQYGKPLFMVRARSI